MIMQPSDGPAGAFERAEQRMFAACGVEVTSRRVRLADPPIAVRVLETGDGQPLVLVHGSGMSASTWAPLMPHLGTCRVIAFDLPGFGLSDPFDYSGRPLREHAVAQLTSLLDALGLDRVPIVGTSLGGMWALSLAVAAPDRVSSLASLGVPAVALPGMRGDPFFTLLSTPGLRHLVARVGSPSVAVTRRSLAVLSVAGVLSERPRVSLRWSMKACVSPAIESRCSATCGSRCGSDDRDRRTSCLMPNCKRSRRPC